MADMENVSRIYQNLTDGVSRDIFSIYLASYALGDIGRRYALPELSLYYDKTAHKKILNFYTLIDEVPTVALCGGSYCHYALKHLQLFYHRHLAIGGIDARANSVDFGAGIEFLTYEEYFARHSPEDATFLVTPFIPATIEAISRNLQKFGVPERRIVNFSEYYLKRGYVEAPQYFDFFSPVRGESFVDGGAYDGRTSLKFVEWCGGLYDAIFAFEPGEEQYVNVAAALGNLKNTRTFHAALWDHDGTVQFQENDVYLNSAGFSLGALNASLRAPGGTTRQCTVDTVSLDTALAGERVTFIKLDVEGGELNALKGAKEILASQKPRLAISVYHRPEDFIVIPEFLMNLDLGYTFTLRHYSYEWGETVLYASV